MAGWKKVMTASGGTFTGAVTHNGNVDFDGDVNVDGSLKSPPSAVSVSANQLYTLDFAAATNFQLSLASSFTLGTINTASCIGQTGVIILIQDRNKTDSHRFKPNSCKILIDEQSNLLQQLHHKDMVKSTSRSQSLMSL